MDPNGVVGVASFFEVRVIQPSAAWHDFASWLIG
jgi:hypothetical protein